MNGSDSKHFANPDEAGHSRDLTNLYFKPDTYESNKSVAKCLLSDFPMVVTVMVVEELRRAIKLLPQRMPTIDQRL